MPALMDAQPSQKNGAFSPRIELDTDRPIAVICTPDSQEPVRIDPVRPRQKSIWRPSGDHIHHIARGLPVVRVFECRV